MSTRYDKKIVMPIETMNRELDVRILLAALIFKAQGSDFKTSIVIGHTVTIRHFVKFLRDGIYFGKHLFGKPRFGDRERVYKPLKSKGFSVLHLNEEGGIWPGGYREWVQAMDYAEDPAVLASDDLLLEWGQLQSQYYRSLGDFPVKILCAGHPRFDMYKKPYRWLLDGGANKIRQRWGKFILINTSTSWANNVMGGAGFSFATTKRYSPESQTQREFHFQNWSKQTIILANIVDLANKLSIAFPDRKIIIRPHPSENIDFYKDVFRGIENVFVTQEGSAPEWILAAEYFISSGSSTAVEAYFLETPVICFLPEENKLDVKMSLEIGHKCRTADEVITVIESNHKDPVSHLSADSKHLLENFNRYVVDDYVDIFVSCLKTKVETRKISRAFFFFFILWEKLYLLLKNAYFVSTGNSQRWGDFTQRFGYFDKNRLADLVALCNENLGTGMKIKSFSKYALVLEMDEEGGD